MDENPYQPPQANSAPPASSRAPMRSIIGGAILGVGVGVSAYGALAFWVFRGLPPNDHVSRLPSLNVMFVGMALMLFGLVFRNLRLR
jgi:hypothetical protein